ncbi:NAD(P)/FAD-dependent oxidoreductase [Oecophyllibacter saccharovorans]|uniref:NAD(P)/FAD-dependent oxidoreductase n=1 Tax=Oecophyllibacter saccharovorans TaxID=2558360 RepID=A0A506ULX8_9PROT|nr:NAD(P)/FAD-dependent oxidoreductase [Oecophyllibacter saccharovorans]QDH15519.1 NAD(P)/FAD-dependent oxidoreductase [Oecophyllibacter saccharovorans]TPW34354.1 NAD(P)/FAD-dependent oxidoreductase [Oecophyllibacter saccharovorans]TPW36539.1 NAD(P)/FAD-dependent oxidoreductase [Oecophyllibacter saccharovorans]
MSSKTRVLILGGGIGGMDVAIELHHTPDVQVTLVDRNPVHVWKPALHEFAAGTLPTQGNLFPFTKLGKRFGFTFVQGAPAAIDRQARTVTLENGEVLPYDKLVVALGARANDFGTPGAQENCFFLDNINEAHALNETLRRDLNRARETGQRLEAVIIGGGATGVQLAAELCEAIDRAPGFGRQERQKLLKLTLIEAAPRVLGPFPESVSAGVQNQLRKIGVDVITSGMVSAIKDNGIELKDGRFIPASLRIWAAGVKAAQATSLFEGLEMNRGGQLVVTPTLQTTRDADIFAVGDCSFIAAHPVPPTAQVARQEGIYVGKTAIPDVIAGREPPPFVYHDRGAVVTLAHYNAWGMLPNREGGNRPFGGHGLGTYVAEVLHEGLYRRHQVGLSGFPTALKAGLCHFFHPPRPDLKAPQPGKAASQLH